MSGFDRIDSAPRILVFLPKAASAHITGKLRENGYGAQEIKSTPDLEDILRSLYCDLVVTTRWNIDQVRAVKSVPVINIEIFFDPTHASKAVDDRSTRFDLNAFLRRVALLTTHPCIGNPLPVFSTRPSYFRALLARFAPQTLN